MPTFTPPTVNEGSSDPFFGRYSIPVGQSVVKKNGHYALEPYPWLGDLVGLTDGIDYFLGGRTYTIDAATASALNADGFTTVADAGYGDAPYGDQGYGL